MGDNKDQIVILADVSPSMAEADGGAREKKTRFDLLIEAQSDQPDALDLLIEAESRSRLRRLNAAMLALSSEDSRLIAAVVLRGLSMAAVARAMSVDRTAVLRQVRRAIRRLRVLLSLTTLGVSPVRIGATLGHELGLADLSLLVSFYNLSFSRVATARAHAIPSRSLPPRLLAIAGRLEAAAQPGPKASHTGAAWHGDEAGRTSTLTSPLPLLVAHDLRTIVEAKAWTLGSHNARYPRRMFLETTADAGVG